MINVHTIESNATSFCNSPENFNSTSNATEQTGCNSFLKIYIDKLKELSDAENIIFSVLNYFNFKNNCYPSFKTVADMTGKAIVTVKRIIYRLRNLGLIDWSLTYGRRYFFKAKVSKTIQPNIKNDTTNLSTIDRLEEKNRIASPNLPILKQLTKCQACTHCKSTLSNNQIKVYCSQTDNNEAKANCNNYKQGLTAQTANELKQLLSKDYEGGLILQSLHRGVIPITAGGALSIDVKTSRIKSLIDQYNELVTVEKQTTLKEIEPLFNKFSAKYKNYLEILTKAVDEIGLIYPDMIRANYFSLRWLLSNENKLKKLCSGKYRK